MRASQIRARDFETAGASRLCECARPLNLPQSYRQAFLAPSPWRSVEHAGAWRAAGKAVSLRIEMPRDELVPVARDQARAALVTVRRLPSDIVHIADIGVAHALFHRDAARHGERRRRR